jgi:hypothetical protein
VPTPRGKQRTVVAVVGAGLGAAVVLEHIADRRGAEREVVAVCAGATAVSDSVNSDACPRPATDGSACAAGRVQHSPMTEQTAARRSKKPRSAGELVQGKRACGLGRRTGADAGHREVLLLLLAREAHRHPDVRAYAVLPSAAELVDDGSFLSRCTHMVSLGNIGRRWAIGGRKGAHRRRRRHPARPA